MSEKLTLAQMTAKYETLFHEKEHIQNQLGQKRMYRPDGSEMGVQEFTKERQILKDAWSWRMATLRRLKSQIAETKRTIQKSPHTMNRGRRICLAFHLMCEDAAVGNVVKRDTAADVANYYQDLVQESNDDNNGNI